MVFFNWETESELGFDGEIFKERVAALGDCRLRHFGVDGEMTTL